MLTWDDDQGTDPQIDEEHHQLYRMMGRLEPVIIDGRKPDTIGRAIRMLRQRMLAHFDMEEELVGGGDRRWTSLLHDDHGELLTILDRLQAVATDSPTIRAQVFAQFLDALAQHDTVVDAPVFRMLLH